MSLNYLTKNFLPTIALAFFSLSISAQCLTPTNVQIDEIRATSADVSWSTSASEPGQGYEYEVRTFGAPGSGITPASGYVLSGNTVDGLLSTTIQTLEISTDYFFYLRYKCAELDFSPWTVGQSFTTTSVQPPVAIAAIYMSDDSFLARWNVSEGATGYYLDVSTDINFTTFVVGYENLFVPINSHVVTDLTPNTTYYYKVRAEGAGPVITADSNTITTATIGAPLDYVVWTQAGWSGDPAYGIDAIIDYDFNTALNGDFVAETLTVNAGNTLTIAEFGSVGVANEIINNAGSTGILLQNNGNLVQINDLAPANVGEITVERNSSEVFRLDYTMWSSPVTGSQSLLDFSPATLSNRFYTYKTSTDLFALVNASQTFGTGEGYLIRIGNTHPAFVDLNSVPASWKGTFVGTPNNGIVEVPLSNVANGYNMVGNPYPSVISAESFLQLNEENLDGSIYFWRRRNSNLAGDENSHYATYSSLGGTASETSDIPNGFIQIGQGFVVKALPTGGDLVFNNDLRVSDNFENQFFRMTNQLERHRMWLNLTSDAGVFSQMLVGYMEGASNGLDRADAKYFNSGSTSISTIFNNNEYTIQAKALPFATTDIIPMNFKTTTAGQYTIALAQFDGFFTEMDNIFLKDKTNNTVTNLKNGNYNFAAAVGNFNDRFEIVFENLLGNENSFNANVVGITTNGDVIAVNSGNVEMSEVSIFDIRGRLLYKAENVNSSTIDITTVVRNEQMLIVKITTEDNSVITKKIIF